MLIDWAWDAGVGLAAIIPLYGMSLVLMERARIGFSLGRRTERLRWRRMLPQGFGELRVKP